MKSLEHKIVKFCMWILAKFLNSKNNYGLFGDIEEIYHYRRSTNKPIYNLLWLGQQIFILIKEYLINQFYWGISMFLNYIKVAFRNLAKYKVISFINILGLSIGIAMSILIVLYVTNEYSVDQFHKDVDRIYKVGIIENLNEINEKKSASVPNPLREVAETAFPQIELAARIIENNETMVTINNTSFLEIVYFVDPEFFDLFSYPLMPANDVNPLKEFSSVVISKEMSSKYFGNENPIGKTLKMRLGDGQYDFVVSSVIDANSESSSIKPTIVVSLPWFKKIFPEDWAWSFEANFGETFVKLKKSVDVKAFSNSIQSMCEHFMAGPGKMELFLIPYTKIHHATELGSGISEVTDEKYNFLLIGLGLLVLIIASINFVTLSVGRSVTRAKEVGVRKVVGANQNQLMSQYISESILTSFVSLVIGSVLAGLFLPIFNELSNKSLSFKFDIFSIGIILLLTIFLGLFSGGYPAFLLAAFKPTKVLKGALKINGKNNLSRVLVLMQFSVSIFLIVATLIIRNQLRYMQEKDLGFNKEKLIEASLNSPLSENKSFEKYEALQSKISTLNNVKGVAAALNQFGTRWTFITSSDEKRNPNEYFYNMVDYNYIETLGLEIISGRNFSREFATDKNEAIIVNEALVNKYGWEKPLEERLPGHFENNPKIIGVVKDFNFSSLHNKVEPLILSLSYDAVNGRHNVQSSNWPPVYNNMIISLGAGSLGESLDNLKSAWQEFYPEDPFVFNFVDERIQKQYEAEMQIGRIINTSSVIAIIIAGLGLFGLATITTENRIKEIGIRKVLGAKIGNILYLVSKDLVVLVLFANLIAWPIAYFVLNFWLQDFAYKVDLSISIFLLAGIIAFSIALATISYHAWRAATSNPVKSLKYE